MYAELQCGDPERGDVALAAALRAFRLQAAGMPMADWPHRFWSLLAAAPLRAETDPARWPVPVRAVALAQLADRAALLLRLVAGLEEPEAAAVLGAGAADYRDALSRACPRDASGQPDADGWRRLADAIQQHLRDLPPARIARLAQVRDAALNGHRLSAPAARTPAPRGDGKAPTFRHRTAWMVGVVVLTAAALAATWWWPGTRDASSTDASTVNGDGLVDVQPVTVEALPPPAPPARRFDEAFAVTTHPDFELLSDPDGKALAAQADFLAWYIAHAHTDTIDADGTQGSAHE